MDYEKLYKEALERAKKLKETCDSKAVVGWCEYIFPELQKHNDEKIRKVLLESFQSLNHGKGLKWGRHEEALVDDIITWLEKQGESSDKIHYWTEEEIEPIISDYLRGAEHYGGMISRLRCLKPKSLEKQSEHKPINDTDEEIVEAVKDTSVLDMVEQKSTWSEADERNLKSIMKIIKEKAFADYDVDEDNNMLGIYGILESWLKSLKQKMKGKLIDKDALVAEIERLVSNGKLKCQQSQENNDQVSYIAWSEHIATLGKIISLLDTLELKKDDKYEIPDIKIQDTIEVSSRMKYINDDLKPIAEFIMNYASWNLHKDEWNQPVLEVPLFRVLDALAQRGKPYCCS